MRIDTFYTISVATAGFPHLAIDLNKPSVKANFDLQAHSFLCNISGPVISSADLMSNGKKRSLSIQLDSDSYIDAEYPFYLFNHSCQPNCGINSDMQLITIRDVSRDEELCWDYSTAIFGKNWKIKCACGKGCCRGNIKDFNFLPEDLQNHYSSLGIVLPFIAEQLCSK